MAFPENVLLVKFPELDEIDSGLMEKAISKLLGKIGSEKEVRLSLSLKDYAKGGLRVQHEVHGHLELNGKKFFASETGWQLLESVQAVLKKLEREAAKSSSKRS